LFFDERWQIDCLKVLAGLNEAKTAEFFNSVSIFLALMQAEIFNNYYI